MFSAAVLLRASCGLFPGNGHDRLMWSFAVPGVGRTLTVGANRAIYVTAGPSIYVFKDDGSERGQWPMLQHDARHTGRSGAY
jgi:hypothetical protein